MGTYNGEDVHYDPNLGVYVVGDTGKTISQIVAGDSAGKLAPETDSGGSNLPASNVGVNSKGQKVYQYKVSFNGTQYTIQNYTAPDEFAKIAASSGLHIDSVGAPPPPADNPNIRANDAGTRYSNPQNLPRITYVEPGTGLVDSALVDGSDPRQFGSMDDVKYFAQQAGETQSIQVSDPNAGVRIAQMWTGDKNYKGYPATPTPQAGSPAARGVEFSEWYSTPISQGGGGSGGSTLNPTFDGGFDPNNPNPGSGSGTGAPGAPGTGTAPGTTTTPGSGPGTGGPGTPGSTPGGPGTGNGITTTLNNGDFGKLLNAVGNTGTSTKDVTHDLMALNLSRLPYLDQTASKIGSYADMLTGMMQTNSTNRQTMLDSLQSPTAFEGTLQNYLQFSMQQRDAQLGNDQFASPYEQGIDNLLPQMLQQRTGQLQQAQTQTPLETWLENLASGNQATRDKALAQLQGPGGNEDFAKSLINQTIAQRDQGVNTAVSPVMDAIKSAIANQNTAQGFTPGQKTAMSNQANDAITQNFLQSRQALMSQLARSGAVGGGETGALPGSEGDIVRQYGGLLGQEAGARSTAQQNISLQDAQQQLTTLMANKQLAMQAAGVGNSVMNSFGSIYNPSTPLSNLSAEEQNRITQMGVTGNIYDPNSTIAQLVNAQNAQTSLGNLGVNTYNLDPIVSTILGLGSNRNQQASIYSGSYGNTINGLANSVLQGQANRTSAANVYGNLYDPTAYIPGLSNFTSQMTGNFNAGTGAYGTAATNANTLADTDPSSFKNLLLASLIGSGSSALSTWLKGIISKGIDTGASKLPGGGSGSGIPGGVPSGPADPTNPGEFGTPLPLY